VTEIIVRAIGIQPRATIVSRSPSKMSRKAQNMSHGMSRTIFSSDSFRGNPKIDRPATSYHVAFFYAFLFLLTH